MDYIEIKNLEVFSKHESSDGEVVQGQKYAIDAKLYFDTREAGVTDDVRKSVDYSAICHFISAFMKGHNFRLIETAAERLADDVLVAYPLIHKISLTVKKPWAPIGLPIEEVSVTIERGWHKAYLALGSNLGNREQQIIQAIERINQNDDVNVIRRAGIFETKPYGKADQPNFYNTAIEINTLMMPLELLVFCKNLESMAGRVVTERFGPRTLDIDILFYDDALVDMPQLTIPHYDIQNRIFVLAPLMQIAPFFRHPVSKLTVREMFEKINNKDDAFPVH